MSQESISPLRPFNNDRMASFGAFRPAMPAAKPQSSASILALSGVNNDINHVAQVRETAAAAVAIEGTAPPKPTHLNEEQATNLVEQMQQEDMMQAHNALDPDRVARLLSLLD